MLLAQLYGTPLGVVVIVGGALVYGALTRSRRRRDDDVGGEEPFVGRWRRFLRSRSSYDYWRFNLVLWLLFLVVALISREPALIALDVFIVVWSAPVSVDT